MKKLLSTVMILALMFTFVACNNSTSSNNETTSKTSSTASSDKSSDTTSEKIPIKLQTAKFLLFIIPQQAVKSCCTNNCRYRKCRPF